ncbi:hypothetical protein [Paraburkholderia hiiakae]|nr:hypothetical protein [Paraburkholderia hiiakae]
MDRASIVLAALKALADEQAIGVEIVAHARQRYGKTAVETVAPWQM